MTVELDLVIDAFADATRRDIFERIVIRPRRVGELASELPVSRPAVSHHIRILRNASLVRDRDGMIEPIVETLPIVRLYFDRLWLEASLGDGWLARRRVETGDFGL